MFKLFFSQEITMAKARRVCLFVIFWIVDVSKTYQNPFLYVNHEYHYQRVLTALILWTVYHHQSLSASHLDKSVRRHPVSAQNFSYIYDNALEMPLIFLSFLEESSHFKVHGDPKWYYLL